MELGSGTPRAGRRVPPVRPIPALRPGDAASSTIVEPIHTSGSRASNRVEHRLLEGGIATHFSAARRRTQEPGPPPRNEPIRPALRDHVRESPLGGAEGGWRATFPACVTPG